MMSVPDVDYDLRYDPNEVRADGTVIVRVSRASSRRSSGRRHGLGR